MRSLRTIIVDDHQACIDEMQKLLQGYPSIEILGTYKDPFAADEKIGTSNPDLLFLDIEMPGLSGLELAGKVKHSVKDCKIIFVTA